MVQNSAYIILQVWYTLIATSVRAFQKKITERVTVNYISWSIAKKYHGPSLKELLKLVSFSEGRHEPVQGLYTVKDLEI